MHRFCALFPAPAKTRLEVGMDANASSRVAQDLRQIGGREPASDKGVRSFPQAFPFVCKVGARNGHKIQDIVVFS
jgi:hypothetical protein